MDWLEPRRSRIQPGKPPGRVVDDDIEFEGAGADTPRISTVHIVEGLERARDTIADAVVPCEWLNLVDREHRDGFGV
jgi:hypothetical protein